MLKRIMCLLTLIMLAFLPVLAQVTTSSMTGTVKDGNGQSLTGATITATHLPSGTRYTVIAGKDGNFSIPNMRIGGPYQVKVDFVGMTSQVLENITLQLGEPYNINAVMGENVQLLENVVVATRARRAAADKTGAATNIGVRQINTLPTISRSITDFTRLTPQANGNSFGGRDSRYNNIQIDGANLNNNFGLSTDALPGGSSQPISLDAIEEVSVNIAPFDVRQANFTGAGISAVTRSGTNVFTGSVYGYYRDESFNGRKVGNVELPAFQESSNKLYGIRFGGPIIKNKLFFFLSGEMEDRTFPGIPWRPSGVGATGSNVSAAHADSLKKLSDYLRTQYGYETGPYDNFPNFGISNTKVLGRIDWNLSNMHKVTMKFSHMKGEEDQQLNGSSIPNGGISGVLTRLNNNRFSNNSMAFANSNYLFENTVMSGTVELNSRFSNKFANQIIGTYTKIQSTRGFNGGFFPTIDFLNNPTTTNQNYMHAGMDPFTPNNDVINKITSVIDNFSYFAGKHTLTAGGQYEYQEVGNMFMPGSNSYYLFRSLNDFITNQAPFYYAYTYSLVPGKKTVYSAELKIAQLGLYLQDEINVNNKLKLTLGLRVDRPIYSEQPLSNPSVAALTFPDKFGKPTKYTTGAFPKSAWYWSPRAGFRWDMQGDKVMILRGGSGLFTGRVPFVWLTNIPTNSGMYQNSVSVTQASRLGNFRFNPNPDQYRDSFPSTAGTSLPVNIVVTSDNWKFPQVWRTNIAMDRNLGNGFNLTVEAIYTKEVNGVWMRNANLLAPNGTANGADRRPRYTGNNRINSNITTAIVLENTNKGGSFQFTTQLQKAFTKGFYGMLAYTYTHAMDVTANPGSQASSVWNANPTSKTQNDLESAYSQYAVPHRIIGAISYRKEYLKTLGTTISLFYEGAHDGVYSYVYDGDMNGDGNNTTDLMYIPRNATEIVFDGNQTINGVTFTPAQQWEILNKFIEQDDYLRKRRGQYAERNGAKFPFYHKVDAKFLQDIFTNIGGRRHTLQFSVDVLNFLNLLNPEWGTRQQTVIRNPLTFRNYNTSGVPTYRIRAANNAPVTKTFQDNISTFSTWGLQVGLRYIF